MLKQRRLSLLSFSFHSLFQPSKQIKGSLLPFSTSISSSPSYFLPPYLQTKCGFSPERAATASKLLCCVKSVDKLESVVNFFKSLGIDDSGLRKLLQAKPRLLARNVEKSFVPKVQALHEIGIEGTDLITLIICYPNILLSNIEHDFVPKFEFWKRICGSNELVMKCIKNRQWMFSCNIKTLVKNDSFLHECGLSHHQISLILTKRPLIIIRRPESLNELVSHVETLGLPRGSPSFHWALYTLAGVSEDNLRAKVELFEGFGWSEDDFAKAFCKSPSFITCSLKDLKEKMEFMVKEAGCTASYVALNPYLLTFSLKKRLIPRVAVLKVLKVKELICGDHKLSTPVNLTKNLFFKRYIDPYKDKEEFPELMRLFSASS